MPIGIELFIEIVLELAWPVANATSLVAGCNICNQRKDVVTHPALCSGIAYGSKTSFSPLGNGSMRVLPTGC